MGGVVALCRPAVYGLEGSFGWFYAVGLAGSVLCR